MTKWVVDVAGWSKLNYSGVANGSRPEAASVILVNFLQIKVKYS
jgi:hypothetical protein